MLEALLGTLIKVMILDQIFPYWSKSMLLAFGYGFFLIVIWNYLLIYWEKYDFTGSWEWMSAKLISLLQGSKLSRFNISEHLYTDENSPVT